MLKSNKKKETSSNLRLGFYFGILVVFIIVISVVFKTIDTFNKSKYDGKHNFTIAVINKNNTQLISVYPKEGKLKKLTIDGVFSENDLKGAGIPYEGTINIRSGFNSGTKSFFVKVLFSRNKTKSNLTFIDLSRLSLFSQRLTGEKIAEDSISVKIPDQIKKISSVWFIDPVFQEENVSIQITNTTEAQGLGNKFAKLLTNMGGNVILVNTSTDLSKKSKIIYSKESHTLRKISKMLEIPIEKKEINSISDIVIIIGEDRIDF